MENVKARFWARQIDMDKLAGAKRACYLVGGYDGSGNYGDIVQLAANIRRVDSLGKGILPVPLIELQYRASHQDLMSQHPSQFGDACFLYYDLSPGPGDDDRTLQPVDGFVEIVHPPPAEAQILVYGGGFFNEWWGTRKLDLIEGLENWLYSGGGDELLPIMILGQQISAPFITGPNSGRFTALLERASAIGVRDEVSLAVVRDNCNVGGYGKLFLSGDDAAPYIIANGGRDEQDVVGEASPADQRHAKPFTLNVHLSLESYVTANPNRLLETVLSIIGDVHRFCGGNLVLNLVVAYEDRRISERRYLEELRRRIAQEGIAVSFISLTSELAHGSPNFFEADLTVCCSYHVALTSLLFCMPTILLFTNEYYSHKQEGLQRQFPMPDELLVDVEEGSRDELTRTVERIVCEGQFRASISALAEWGAQDMFLKVQRATALFRQWWAAG